MNAYFGTGSWEREAPLRSLCFDSVERCPFWGIHICPTPTYDAVVACSDAQLKLATQPQKAAKTSAKNNDIFMIGIVRPPRRRGNRKFAECCLWTRKLRDAKKVDAVVSKWHK